MRELNSSAKVIKNIVKIAKFVLFGLVVLAIILLLIQNNVSFAQEDPDPGKVLYDFVSVNLYPLVGTIIGLLAVFMIIVAGVIYIFDLGGGKQIGLAKEMIVSAISGLLLFIIASFLLGEVNLMFSPLNDIFEGTGTEESSAPPLPDEEPIIPPSGGGGGGQIPEPPGGSGPFGGNPPSN